MGQLKDFLNSLKILQPVIMARRRYLDWKRDLVRNVRVALGKKEGLFVVQIGSNDGLTLDPLRVVLLENPSWRALFVEPVPYLFDQLRKNYGDHPRFQFENAAISEKSGTMPFYYISENARERLPDLPEWYNQIGSFDRQNLSGHLGDSIEEFVLNADIKTLSLPALFERYAVARVDLLHIDTEGHDWVILRQLDLERYTPIVILFEHKHLSEQAKSEALAFLRNKYRIRDFGGDYLCRRKNRFGF